MKPRIMRCSIGFVVPYLSYVLPRSMVSFARNSLTRLRLVAGASLVACACIGGAVLSVMRRDLVAGWSPAR